MFWHLARGAVGFGAFGGAMVLATVSWPSSAVLVAPGLLVLRGCCPSRWAIELIQTVSGGRLRRACTDSRCESTKTDGRPSGQVANVTRPERR